MTKLSLSLAGVVTIGIAMAASPSPAAAQEPEGGPPGVEAGGELPPDYQPPIPPYTEGEPVAAEGGGYCYVGSHPVDTRVAAGNAWEDAYGAHIHYYPPVDMRLFAFKDGCYYFIGDPADFGYQGTTYDYYGAHPVQDAYGGGWCFMIGPHRHSWQPWSASFVAIGARYYWDGAYDGVFWSYWPYYAHYYRSYYPQYYGGGRFYTGGRAFRAAPPIARVPRPATGVWRGATAGVWQGATAGAAPAQNRGATGGGWRGTAAAPVTPQRSAPAYGGGGYSGWRGGAPAASAPRYTPYTPSPPPAPGATVHPYTPPRPSAPAASAGGFRVEGAGGAAWAHPSGGGHPAASGVRGFRQR